MEIHKPVLLREVLAVLNPQPGEIYFDGTANGGGHLEQLLEGVGMSGKVIGFDWDCDLIKMLQENYPKDRFPNVEFKCANYTDTKKIFKEKHWGDVNGILLDLGFSSYHIDHSGAGFSFLKDEPLDMRYHRKVSSTDAHTIVNSWSKEELEKILREYGEEKFANRIAYAIVESRKKKKITTSHKLAEIIYRAVPYFYRRDKIHPATRTFQALRIAVNHELDNLIIFLQDVPDLLNANGKVAIISFHSIEDRIVKKFFKSKEKEGIFKIITNHPIRATREECAQNPRSRSAKLRAAVKINPK